GRVLDEGPALQGDLVLGVDAQAVGGFPYRPFDDIGGLDRAFAGAVERDGDRFLLRVMRAGQYLQGALELVLERRILELHRADLVERDRLDAGRCVKVEDLDVGQLALTPSPSPRGRGENGPALNLQADDGASDLGVFLVAARDFDL